MRFLERYLAGQTVAVWTEVTSLGPMLRDEPTTLAEVERVGRETMQRARRNVEQLVDRLPGVGYVFANEPGLPTFKASTADDRHTLDELERLVGPIPLAMRWWLEEVGQVNLQGHHPDWDDATFEPLVVQCPPEWLLSEAHEWHSEIGTEWERVHFDIEFSPDLLHKRNISGGPAYSVVVPNAGADGLVAWEHHQTTFVGLLRLAFRGGGFTTPAESGTTRLPADLRSIAAELEPI